MRVEVAQALAEQLGTPISAALMEVIPPFGWHEIATRADLAALERRMDARFDIVDARFGGRFDAVDAQFRSIDARFDAIDERFRSIDARFLAVDARFAALEHQLDTVDGRFDSLRAELTGAFHTEISRLVRWTVGMIATTVATGVAVVTAVAALS
jgi:tetrahydromethanopterin S-methyltransferase subunit G